MHLYAYIDRPGEGALFCDTDSVIFVQKKGEPPLIQRGEYLGDMTSELKGSEFISELVSGGPKNYSYKLGEMVTGMRGVCVSCEE